MKTITHFILVLGFIITLIQCKSDKTNVSDTDELAVSDNDSEIMFLLPSPDEIINEIFMENMKPDPSFVNPVENSVKYIDTRYQAIVLGVYIADFAYLSYTDETHIEIEYLKVIRDLSEKINLFGLIDESVLNRIQANIINGDSLQSISQELYYKLSDLLENTNRNNIFALITTGAIVESLYLASMNINNISDFENMVTRIFEQKYVFDNFYNFTMQYSSDVYVKSILGELNELKLMFEQLQATNVETKVSRGEGNQLKIEGGTQFIINDEAFKNFKKSITQVRKSIVTYYEK